MIPIDLAVLAIIVLGLQSAVLWTAVQKGTGRRLK